MLFHELLTETYKSKRQARLFHACASGADYDACKGTSQKKWKSMAKEFSASTPDESSLPERKRNHAENCMCNYCKNMSKNYAMNDEDDVVTVEEDPNRPEFVSLEVQGHTIVLDREEVLEIHDRLMSIIKNKGW